MAMAIKPGSLCYLRAMYRETLNGRVVTAVRHATCDLVMPDGEMRPNTPHWIISAPWLAKSKNAWGVQAQNLVPIDDPDGADGCRYREPLAPTHDRRTAADPLPADPAR